VPADGEPGGGFERILRKTWRDNRLFSVLVELTYRCNLDCFFCYNDLGLVGTPMAREDWLRLFDDLAHLGVLHLTLSGGEPLAHPHFLALGGRARELGFVVRVKSNGHALRGELARRLRDEVDPFVVEISLHGATAAVHDRQTRVPGSFERLLANLRELEGLGLRVQLNTTLTAWNEGEIEEMFALAAGLGLPLRVDPVVTPRDDGDRSPLAVSPSRAGVRQLFRLLEEQARGAREGGVAAVRMAREGDDGPLPGPAPGPPAGEIPLDKHCGAGSAGVAVDPFGNVYPCVQWRRPVGNLHRHSIQEIWEGAAGLGEVRAITTAAKRVVDGFGEAGPLLNFCPGAAALATGDPLTVDAAARERMALALEARGGPPLPSRLPIVG
jgi:mycofactocin biosynthetic radical S-adenosylmethionine protein MftC